MRSSGASWLPRSEMQGSPTSSANCCTREDLPMPGGPQINTGRTNAVCNRKWLNSEGVMVILVFIAGTSNRLVVWQILDEV